MHCLKCGAGWRIGNVSPSISACPVCDTDFNKETEYRGFDSIAEFMMCLIVENGNDICLNNLQITSFLNDFYPGEALLRKQIEELLSNGIGEYVYQYRNGDKPINDLETIVNRSSLGFQLNSIEKTVNYLIGRVVEEGTNVGTASFFLDQLDQLYDINYKIGALEKANSISPSIYSIKLQADLLLEIGEYDRAINVLEKAAESENEAALLQLASVYEKGEKSQRNYDRMVELYFRLEKQGSSEGMFHLGRLYYLGKGVDKSISKAVEFFSRSAEKGNYRAQYYLYRILYKDNPKAATEYLIQAAEQRFEPAMYNLAIHMLYGDDVKKDVSTAVYLLEECSKSGNRDAASKLFYMYMTGYEIEADKDKALQYKILLGEK